MAAQGASSDTPVPLPSLRRLISITSLALVGAAAVFVAFVLPAEFHRDPLGIGRLTGLDRLAGPETVSLPLAAPGQATASRISRTSYRADTIDIPLATGDAGRGGEELEYKVRMRAGDSIVYAWSVDSIENPEEFYFDFHGESPPDPTPKVVEYLQSTGTSSRGALTAPMTGVHGWYLQNQSAKPVVVHLKISGFYELVPPGEKGNEAGIVAGGPRKD